MFECGVLAVACIWKRQDRHSECSICTGESAQQVVLSCQVCRTTPFTENVTGVRDCWDILHQLNQGVPGEGWKVEADILNDVKDIDWVAFSDVLLSPCDVAVHEPQVSLDRGSFARSTSFVKMVTSVVIWWTIYNTYTCFQVLFPCTFAFQEIDNWDVTATEPGYIMNGCDQCKTAILCPGQVCQVCRSWESYERCTAILVGSMMVLSDYMPRGGYDEENSIAELEIVKIIMEEENMGGQ